MGSASVGRVVGWYAPAESLYHIPRHPAVPVPASATTPKAAPMLSKTYHLKFPSLDAAQIAAPFVIEALGNAIPACNLTGLNVLISKEGDVSINVFFPSVVDLKAFEKNHGGFLDTMKKTFLFKSTGFDGVCIFNFDRSEDEAA
jgi:hypothetical protein